MTGIVRIAAAAAVLTLGCSSRVAAAALTPDPAGVVAALPAAASPHWVWVNDIVFPHMSDGQARLIDGDTGRVLGLLDTGFAFERVVLAEDSKVIFSPETYFSRGTRGTRTDVITLYDPVHLAPRGEISIPPKRAATMPMMADAGLTDDGAFLIVYNYTPAQSVTVVDTRRRRFAGEIETPGCALVYPTGPRSFFSICADGAVLDVHLDDAGHVARRVHTRDFFDVSADPVTEKGVRLGSRWLFVSYGGTVYSVDIAPRGLEAGPRWSLLSDAERRQNWRPGGLQQLAVHARPDRLYAIMHQGGPETHKDPGKEVWVYDVDGHRRVQRIALRSPAGSIEVTRDEKPLLFAVFIGSTTLEVYDAQTGRYLRSVQDVGTTPTLLVSP